MKRTWSQILAEAGIPEPPGRGDALAALEKHMREKRERQAAEREAKGGKRGKRMLGRDDLIEPPRRTQLNLMDLPR